MKIYQFESKNKFEARRKNVEFFRKESGLEFIPDKQCYLTLCGLQSDNFRSEINQLSDMGFINKKQYTGIDRDRKVITANRKVHPEARWFCGEWKNVLSTKIFRPAMIYLDTTNFVGAKTIINLTEFTMLFCPVNSFLFINVMLSNPHSGDVYDHEEFMKSLKKYLTREDCEMFEFYQICFTYSATGLTKMGTYPFRRIK